MTYKYAAELYNQPTLGTIGEYGWMNRILYNDWFCREIAVNEIDRRFARESIWNRPTVLRLAGLNMRPRTFTEQRGIARFASIMFPDHFTFVDDKSLWIESKESIDDYGDTNYVYPMNQLFSVAWFYIKYLSIQMQDRITIDKLCKTFIKRKHQCFHGIPDQQLGTAFYVWSYIAYRDDMLVYKDMLSRSNGPGTAMRQLANEDEEKLDGQTDESKFYSFLLDEWISQYKPEITKMMDYHVSFYPRSYYMPVLMQDIYKRIYDGNGYFDGLVYGDDEW